MSRDRYASGLETAEHVWIGFPFGSNRRHWAVAGIHAKIIRQLHDSVDRITQVLDIGCRKIKPSDRTGEERITHDRLFGFIMNEAYAAGAMAGRVHDSPRFTRDLHRVAIIQVPIRLDAGDVHADEA